MVSREDRRLFRAAIRGVRPLGNDTAQIRPATPPPRPLQREADDRAVLAELRHAPLDPHTLETGDELLYHRPGITERTLRRLRRGQFAVQGHLDLHGHTVPQAHTALAEFLREAGARGARCVRIVHGKGLGSAMKLPVLKGKVGGWLRRNGDVLAFCPAPPHDGGTGAVYVLLRKT